MEYLWIFGCKIFLIGGTIQEKFHKGINQDKINEQA